MKENGKKLSPAPKDFPLLKKRGICIYIQDVFIIADLLKSLFEIIEKKRRWLPVKKRLRQEEATGVMKEAASYIYFETVKQIRQYGEGDLSEKDAREVLDTVSSYFYYSYYIEDLQEKLEEYQTAENPIEHVSRNLERIARGEHWDSLEQAEIAATIASVTIHTLFDGIGRMFKLSENETAEVIEDFFVNHYPRFTKQ